LSTSEMAPARREVTTRKKYVRAWWKKRERGGQEPACSGRNLPFAAGTPDAKALEEADEGH